MIDWELTIGASKSYFTNINEAVKEIELVLSMGFDINRICIRPREVGNYDSVSKHSS